MGIDKRLIISIPVLLIASAITYINETNFIRQNKELSDWIRIEMIFFILVSFNGMTRSLFRKLEVFQNCFCDVLLTIMSVTTIVLGVINPFFLVFLLTWTIHGLMIGQKFETNMISYGFTLTFYAILVLQTVFFIVLILLVFSIVAFFTPYKKQIGMERRRKANHQFTDEQLEERDEKTDLLLEENLKVDNLESSFIGLHDDDEILEAFDVEEEANSFVGQNLKLDHDEERESMVTVEPEQNKNQGKTREFKDTKGNSICHDI